MLAHRSPRLALSVYSTPVNSMPFRLVTLGDISLYDAETERRLAVPRKALALLGVLASAGPRGVSRERVLSLLWPDAGDGGRGALKQTIYELRQTLGDHSVVSGTTELTIDEAQVATDVGDLEGDFSEERWPRVVELYSGPFMDRFHVRASPEFEHWVDSRRAHYAGLFRRALERYATAVAERGSVDESVALWRRLAAEDPFSGRYALGLMNALVASGDHAAALTHYRVHQQLLQDGLGTVPDAAVTSAAQRIRERKCCPAEAAEEPPPVAPERPATDPHESAAATITPPVVARRTLPGALLDRRLWVAGAIIVIAAGALAARAGDHARVLRSIPLPPNASARVSVDLHLNKIYVGGGARFDDALMVVNGESYEAKALPHGAGIAVEPLTQWYWAGDYEGRFVVVRNGRTDIEIARVGVPGCPHTLAIGGEWTWVAQQCDDHISVIETRTRKVIRHIPIATLSRAEVGGAKGMGEILVNRNTGIVYFSKDMIPHRLDPRSWQARETPAFGGPLLAINDATNRLYTRIDNGLKVIDGSTEKVVTHVQLASTPARVAVGFGGRRVYVVTPEALSVLDGATNSILSTLAFANGFRLTDIAVDDARDRAYVLGVENTGTASLKIVALRD